MKLTRLFMLLLGVVCVAWLCSGCQKESATPGRDSGRLQVVATLFPLYDMARSIAGEKADVLLLLPPGMEPHNFEPRPDDILRINRAGLFVYTNRQMEPWAHRLIQGGVRQSQIIVDASTGLKLMAVRGETGDDHRHEASGGGAKVSAHDDSLDPHVWLDLDNAGRMVDTILAGFIAGDPANRPFYEANAAVYRRKLAELDRRFKDTLGSCRSRTLLHGGHYAFGYLAHRYGLEYMAATGVSADSEPTPGRLGALVRKVRTLGLTAIFTEELVAPRIAETIASETGAEVLKLHAGHNVSRDELAKGITFPAVMEQNLLTLAKGLQCSR